MATYNRRAEGRRPPHRGRSEAEAVPQLEASREITNRHLVGKRYHLEGRVSDYGKVGDHFGRRIERSRAESKADRFPSHPKTTGLQARLSHLSRSFEPSIARLTMGFTVQW